MSDGTEGIARYTVTRRTLVEALRNIPLTAPMTGEALVKMAGAILGQLPAVPADALARLAELENAVNWNTSCLACATVLDSSIAEHERAERAEEKLAAVVGELGQLPEASPAASYMEGVKAERERIAELAEERKARYPVSVVAEDGYLSTGSEPFAPLIRDRMP